MYRALCMCVRVRARARWVYPLVRLLPLPMKSHYIIDVPPRWRLMKLVRKQDFTPGRISRRSKRWGDGGVTNYSHHVTRDPCPRGMA